MIVHSNIIGEGEPFVILHGFLGMGDNWKTLAKQFAADGYQVHLIDQRNHGRSFHSDTFSYEVLVEDLKLYCEENGLDKIHLLGHSMGGKTVMQFLMDYPERVASSVVVDISPKSFGGGHEDIFKALLSLDINNLETRSDAQDHMKAHLGDTMGVIFFLLKNLGRKPTGGFKWKANISSLWENYDNIKAGISGNEKVEKNIEGIEFVVPRNMNQALVVRNFLSGNFSVSGDYPLLDKVQKKNLIEGRFINQNDINENKKVCVISDDVYEQLYDKEEEVLGTYLKVNNIGYKVVGVYKPGRIGGGGNTIHIPFSTFRLVYNSGNKFQWMMVTGKAGFDIEQVETDVKGLLKNIHKIHPDDSRAFNGFNLGKEIAKVTGFLTGMQFLTWFVGIATLIAGVFAIGNILLITVKERTKEIGIRRALGATPIKIRQQIILESIFLTLLAGSLGIIAGGLILMLIDSADILTNPTVNIPIVLIAYAVLIILGTFIGFIPAYMATIIQPIEALREE